MPVFSALGQTTRIRAWTLLLDGGSAGMTHGALAAELDVPKNILTAHLKILEAAGLVAVERAGRSKIYRIAPETARLAAETLLARVRDTDR